MSTLAGLLLPAAGLLLAGGLLLSGALVAVRTVFAVRLVLSDGSSPPASPLSRIRARDVVHWAMLAGGAVLLGGLAARTVATGHAPWSNLHEFSAAFAAALVVAYAVLERRHPLRPLAPVVAALAIGLVLMALSFDDRIDPLVPALQQPLLLTIHVGSAVVAYAVSGVAFAAALGELIQRQAGVTVPALPPAEACRAVAHRCVLVAFPILTLAIALGSVWANLAWRSYWSNDPKELAAAATWLVFGAYLHVAGRRDRWSALAPWLIVLGFAAVLFTYLAASLVFVGEHSYAAP